MFLMLWKYSLFLFVDFVSCNLTEFVYSFKVYACVCVCECVESVWYSTYEIMVFCEESSFYFFLFHLDFFCFFFLPNCSN